MSEILSDCVVHGYVKDPGVLDPCRNGKTFPLGWRSEGQCKAILRELNGNVDSVSPPEYLWSKSCCLMGTVSTKIS